MRRAIPLLLILLMPAWAFGAIGIGSSCTGLAEAIDTFTFSCAPGASGSDRYVSLGLFRGDDTTTITSFTYGGVALTRIIDSDLPAFFGVSLWGLIAPATGAQDVVFNITTGESTGVAIGITAYTGVHQTTAEGTPVESHGPGTASRSVDITSATGELVVDVFGACDDAGLAPGAGQTEQYVANTGVSLHSSTEAGAATTTMSWSWTNPDCSMLAAVPLKPAAGVAARRRGGPLWLD